MAGMSYAVSAVALPTPTAAVRSRGSRPVAAASALNSSFISRSNVM